MMDNLERIEVASDRVTDFQKRYNVNSKAVAALIGRNLTLLICVLIPLLLIGYIWTDLTWFAYSHVLLAEGLITMALFFIGETMMTMLGTDGGRLDTEYVTVKAEYDMLVSKCGEIGTLLMGVFCEWQIDTELQQAKNARLRKLEMTPEMWEKVKNFSPQQLEAQFGKIKADKLVEIANLKPINLNEAILLYNGDYTARGDIPRSADDYLSDRKHLIATIIVCVFTAILTISVAITLTSDVTIARVLYTAFKLIILMYRMAKGYARGAKAYNTIEVRRLKEISKYLRRYIKFVETKLYLKLGNKYGDIGCFVADD